MWSCPNCQIRHTAHSTILEEKTSQMNHLLVECGVAKSLCCAHSEYCVSLETQCSAEGETPPDVL